MAEVGTKRGRKAGRGKGPRASVASKTPAANPRPFASGLDLLDALLALLDERLARRVETLQAAASSETSLPGLVITDSEVGRLLSGPATLRPWSLEEGDGPWPLGLWSSVEERVEASREAGVHLPLDLLQQRFRLTSFEIDCLVVCLATEVDSRYERLFAYLNDDLTRRCPTVDLLLRLLCPAGEHPIRLRRLLSRESTLLSAGLLRWVEAEGSGPYRSLLARGLAVAPGVAHTLLQEPQVVAELAEVWARSEAAPGAQGLWARNRVEQPLGELVDRFLERRAQSGERRVITLLGRGGSGRRYAAEAACAQRGMPLISIDGRRLRGRPDAAAIVRAAFRDSVLHAAPVLLEGCEALSEAAGADLRLELERLMAERGWLLFLLADKRSDVEEWFPGEGKTELRFAPPSEAQRVADWTELLSGAKGLDEDSVERLSAALAAKFHLTSGQAAATLRLALSSPEAHAADGEAAWTALLDAAAARVGAPKLAELARRLSSPYRWGDIVLPEQKLEVLKDVARHVHYRRQVMDEWGFGAALNRGKGLTALFSGPPGTGKTMAAEILGNELGMELYRIDLASVVSKYIGETEKNLGRIFDEAESADALLFFDEADALFGKRSEVKDAHDRYANIEINYLLQRMEAYEGIAILASNLRQNLDHAFLRRIQVVLEFPVPTAEDRLRIWRRCLPPALPVAPDVDLAFLAKGFDLAGGSIRNIGLAAAYLAAEQGDELTMRHLIQATHRELEKLGKRSVKDQFGPYFELLELDRGAPGRAAAR